MKRSEKKPTSANKSTVELIPVGDRVLIAPADTATETPGGIVLPDTSKERPQNGVVLAIGPDVKQAARGDRAYFSRYAERMELDEFDYIIIKEGDLYALQK